MTVLRRREAGLLAAALALLVAVTAFWMAHLGDPAVRGEGDLDGPRPPAVSATATARGEPAALAPIARGSITRGREWREPSGAPAAVGIAPIEALAISRASGEPVPFLRVLAVDRNGVPLVLWADSEGRLASEDVLALGPVALYGRPGPITSYGSSNHTLLETTDLGAIPFARNPLATVQHLASTGAPARWEVPVPRLVPLRDESGGKRRAPIMVAFTVTGTDRDHLVQPERVEWDAELASIDLRDATHVVRMPGRVELEEPWAWEEGQAAAHVPDRHLHAAVFEGYTILVTTIAVPRVPRLGEEPLQLRFAPLTLTEPSELVVAYGKSLGEHIARRLAELRRFQDEALRAQHSIAGTITSDSGSFDGRILVRARPQPAAGGSGRASGSSPRRSSAQVRWLRQPDGRTIGRFEIKGLDAADYALTFHGRGATIVEPSPLVVSAPVELEGVAATVRDGLERAAVAITVSRPDGTQVPEFEAALTADYRGSEVRTSIQAPGVPPVETFGTTVAAPVVLIDDLPKDADFTVEITRLGTRTVRLVRDDFEWLDGRWHAQVDVQGRGR